MFELGETIVGEEIMPFCSPLVGNELAYVTSMVCSSGAKRGLARNCQEACLAAFSTTSLPVKSTCEW